MKKIFLSAAAFLILLYCHLGFISNAVRAQDPSYETVIAEAIKGNYELIEIDALWKRYQQDDTNLLLVDTRQEWEYNAGFIKGALNFPLEPTWLARMTQRGALELFLGPDKTKALVFY